MASIRVLVADGHKWVRQGLRDILESSGDIAVVAEAETGPEAIDLSIVYQPDVVLIDLLVPGLGGVAAAKAIKGYAANIRIIVLTANEDHGDVMARFLWQNNIDGYLVKTCELCDLQQAVKEVTQGIKVYRPSLAACSGSNAERSLG